MVQVGISGDRPTAFADLTSLTEDLEFAGRAFERAMQLNDGSLEHRALWEAGLISYRRCFEEGRPAVSGGYRSRLEIPFALVDELFANDEDLRAVHLKMLELAKQHVAHRSHATATQSSVVLLLSDPSMGREVLGVHCFTMQFAVPTDEFIAQAIAVSARLFAALSVERKELADTILGEFQAREPLELYPKGV
jgi:hypothetical protein